MLLMQGQVHYSGRGQCKYLNCYSSRFEVNVYYNFELSLTE